MYCSQLGDGYVACSKEKYSTGKLIKKCSKQYVLDELEISGNDCSDAWIHGREANICFCQQDGCNNPNYIDPKIVKSTPALETSPKIVISTPSLETSPKIVISTPALETSKVQPTNKPTPERAEPNTSDIKRFSIYIQCFFAFLIVMKFL